MKWIKTIDEKIKKLGFAKQKESKLNVTYVRCDSQFNYVQVVELGRKAAPNKHWLLHSYQQGVNSEGFNNSVGLTAKEVKLFYKKGIKKWGKR